MSSFEDSEETACIFRLRDKFGEGRLGNNKKAVRELAYKLWELAGYPPGDDIKFWHGAEKKLIVDDALHTEEGRRALVMAMISPIRT